MRNAMGRIACLTTLAASVACASARRESGPPLAGKRWRLVELGGAPALSAGDSSRAPQLLFATDSGRVTGSTGCNHLSGSFTRSADTLHFGPAVMTKMACADTAVMRQEFVFVAALDSTRRYEVLGDTLTLLGDTGVLARFVGKAP
jgi:heat shock protein HslJ